MLAAQFLNLLYNIVDRIYISRIPGTGTAALGAVGLCFPVITIIAAFTNLFGSGGAPLFAIARGRGDSREAGMLMDTVFWLELGSAILLMAAGWLFGRPILRLFGASGEALVYSLPYLQIYLAGTVFSMLASGLNPFIVAQGYPRAAMVPVMIGAAAPCAATIVQMVVVNGKDAMKASIYNVMSTILCVVTIPVMILLFQILFPG